MKPKQRLQIVDENIERKIYIIRGQKVMFDRELARLYGVETKVLLQAVKRNHDRFPEDFMFRLNWEETDSLRSQIVTLKQGAENSRSQFVTLKRGQHIKYLPYAFTEQGVAMLSSVLRSKRAMQVNIAIMRTFVKLKQNLSANKKLAEKLQALEGKLNSHDKDIQTIFEAIRRLMTEPEKPKRRIGFHAAHNADRISCLSRT